MPGELVPVDLKVGTFPFPAPDGAGSRPGPPADSNLPFPAPERRSPRARSVRSSSGCSSPFRLGWTDLRIKHLKDIFFSKGSRACLFFPGHLRAAAEDDALHPGRRALRLSFELPKGSYATILVKRITDAAEAPP